MRKKKKPPWKSLYRRTHTKNTVPFMLRLWPHCEVLTSFAMFAGSIKGDAFFVAEYGEADAADTYIRIRAEPQARIDIGTVGDGANQNAASEGFRLAPNARHRILIGG